MNGRTGSRTIEAVSSRAVELSHDSDLLRAYRTGRLVFLEGGKVPQAIRKEVRASWRRSRSFGVVADAPRIPYNSDLGRAGRLTAAAKPVFDRFSEPLHGTHASLILVDRYGWVRDRSVGARELMRQLDSNRTDTGFTLDEQHAGTNGPGTAMEICGPVTICGPEHFADQYQELTCASAPIIHPITGRVEGIVNLTCPLAETNAIMLPYVVEAAAGIAERLWAQASGDERVLLDHFLMTSRGTTAPVITLNEHLIMANASAVRMLERADQGLLWERVATVVGSGETDTWELGLSTGGTMRMRCRPVFDGNDLLGAVLVGATDDDGPAPRPGAPPSMVTLPGLVTGRSQAWAEVARSAIAVSRSRMPCLIEGEPGTGKATLARAMRTMAGGDPADAVELDAAQVVLLGSSRWLDVVEHGLGVPGTCVVLLHLEALDDQTARGLSALVDSCPDPAQILATHAPADRDPCDGVRNVLNRLRVARIEMPPLRHRLEDLPALVEAFVARHGSASQRLRPEAMQMLGRADWPGNIRELENVVRWVVSTATGPQIGIDALPGWVLSSASSRRLTAIERSEFETIVKALRDADGNKRAAAEALGLARSTLYRKLRAYGIDLERTIY